MPEVLVGMEITTGSVVGNTGTDIFNVLMPADVQAGDYLFVLFGGSFSLRKIDHEQPNGTWTNIGTGDSHARIADGTEGGTLVPFLSWNGGFTGNRPISAVALCYRFPVPPSNIGGLYLGGTLSDLGSRTYTNSTGDSFRNVPPFSPGGQFGGNVAGGRSEFRLYHAEGVTNDTSLSYDPTAMLWNGDLIHDRTGLLVPPDGTFPDGIDAGGHSVADAFYLSVPTTGGGHSTRLDVDGPGTSGSGRMEGWVVGFPLLPDCVEESSWGQVNTNDSSTGFVEAGFQNTGTDATPAPGSLIIATATRWGFPGSTPGPGTLTGFGATWELIYSEALSSSMSAGFMEVYRAQQPSYTTGKLRYSYAAGSVGDFIDSAVGYIAYTGVTPAGLSDNGASAIQNITNHGPTVDTQAEYSQAVTNSEYAINFSAWWRVGNAGSAGSSDPEFRFATGPGGAFWVGRATNPSISPQDSLIIAMFSFYGTDVDIEWHQAPIVSRNWRAMSVEIVGDPECTGVLLSDYWGILAS